MERKKGIPLVALVIFIALLVAIILTCVIILGANKNDKKTGEQNNAQAIGEQTPPPAEPENVTLESEDLINADEDVRNAYKLTGNGKTFAKYAIYSSGGFDETKQNTTSNLKLKLAMAQVTNSDMDKSSTTKTIPKGKVAEYAKKIFSNVDDLEYKDFSIFGSDSNFTEKYKTIGYVYSNQKESYEIQENEIEEDTPSEITEVVTKVVKEGNKMEIYVKPVYIETFYSDEVSGMACSIYGGYNYGTKEYEDLFISIAYTDYDTVLKSAYNKDLDGYKYSELSSNIDLNKCKDYKYTFVKDANGYKLQAFEEVV